VAGRRLLKKKQKGEKIERQKQARKAFRLKSTLSFV
jgi:hypothetical protein